MEAVNKLVSLVEGELEECTNSLKPTVPEVKSTKGTGKDGKGTEARKEPCYFFNETEDGSNRGQHCSRYHRKLNPEEKKCYVCGSTKHLVDKCDRPKKRILHQPKELRRVIKENPEKESPKENKLVQDKELKFRQDQ